MAAVNIERELAGHVHVARESWAFAQQWAAGLSMAELRQAYRLVIPGDAGMAVEQELRRRTNPDREKGA